MSRSQLATALLYSLLPLFACSAPVAAPTTRANDGGASHVDESGGDGGVWIESEPGWCAARAVLQAKCQRCHSEPLEHGAPFPLLSYDDTQVADRKGSLRYEKMKAAVESEYMPPQFLALTPAVEPLTADESATLISWLSGEPPLDARHCD